MKREGQCCMQQDLTVCGVYKEDFPTFRSCLLTLQRLCLNVNFTVVSKHIVQASLRNKVFTMLLTKSLVLLLAALLHTQFSLAAPVVEGPVEVLRPRNPLHTCAVFAQRWFDNSFDLQAFGYDWTANGVFQGIAKAEIETTSLPVGTVFTTQNYIGSYQFTAINTADPAVINGSVNWNDPGKLSFIWGTEKFDTFSPGNTCVTIAVGFSPYGYATNYTCPFQCDS
ncbi:hypothetical protein V8E51_011630 [Hyaloscypha variabilis]